MNEKGLKLLAKEIAGQIYRRTESTVTARLHKHKKGVPRNHEISELRKTEKYKRVLALALEKNRLYQDCINLNTEPDSLLMQEYMENEEAYDAVAGSCRRHIRAEARRYQKEQEEIRQLKRLRTELLDRVPERMADLFPATRKMNRHFVLHIGATNSGKTYSSIERMREAESGIYLGPLRLLAFEQYEKLNLAGYPCTLYTGEEHQIIPGARLQASTIEMADDYAWYDIAVIDEAQMVTDPERGWAWTKAILGLRAEEIHVCMAPYAEEIVISLIRECGDSFEIVRHERQTPLIRDESVFSLKKKSIRKHDALIVFSRRNVHAVASELRNMGINCSVIYGNLPYDVRQEEARRFRDGETDVVVATDAIGMGMNLPIERIVFLEVTKFDGIRRRLLEPSEIQQIAGRAGRLGMYPKGLWNSLENTEIVEAGLEEEIPQIKEVFVGLPESLIGIDDKLSSIITEWRNVKAPEGYRISALMHEYELCLSLEDMTDDKDLIYRLITIPFDEEETEVRDLWESACRIVISGQVPDLGNLGIESPRRGISLDDAEQLYRKYDLAYACLEKFGSESETEIVLEYKKELSAIIADTLKTSALSYKKCKHCGKRLRWNYPYGMCQECFNRIYGGRR